MSNTPTEFIVTPDNLLDVLMEWLPEHLEKMRLYQSDGVSVEIGLGNTVELRYGFTIGGEKYKVSDRNYHQQDSATDYLSPIGADDDVILSFAVRVNRMFQTVKRGNKLLNRDTPLQFKMTFLTDVFSNQIIQQPSKEEIY